MKKRGWISLAILIGLLWSFSTARAQTPTPPAGPVYIVQSGDSLWVIAARFNISVDELAVVNGITDPSAIQPGDELVIPGLPGIQGVLNTVSVPFGETLDSLSLRYGMEADTLARLNRIASPAEVFVGMSLIILENESIPPAGRRISLAPGQSLLELAISHGTDPWTLTAINSPANPAAVLPGDILRLPAASPEAADLGPGALPYQITAIALDGLVQGHTTRMRLTASAGLTSSGDLMGHTLFFFTESETSYVALQGIHAMAEPGLYPLTLQGALPDGTPFGFTQLVLVSAGDFLYDPPLYVDPATVDPEVTQPENELWNSLVVAATAERMWSGTFQAPVEAAFAECWPSRFGSRRSYNDSGYNYFHTGLDFCGQIGDAVYAPAPGVVVYTGQLSVRGNATMIDHGWGVYSGYMHQSEILVQPGEAVEMGQLIGLVGNTGRVTGPHLHFEIWVGGVLVDPLDWLTGEFP